MKLKITITGPNVHDVGYRPWLTELAMSMALRGFEVYNDEEDGQQTVIALAEADDQRIQRFYNTVGTKQPQLAMVGGVTSEEYTGEVMPLWQAAAMNTSTQLNKAIPLLLDMRDDLKAVKNNTDLIPQIAKTTERTANTTDKILEEAKGLREDQPSVAMQLRQLRQDVEAIKAQLKMP